MVVRGVDGGKPCSAHSIHNSAWVTVPVYVYIYMVLVGPGLKVPDFRARFDFWMFVALKVTSWISGCTFDFLQSFVMSFSLDLTFSHLI